MWVKVVLVRHVSEQFTDCFTNKIGFLSRLFSIRRLKKILVNNLTGQLKMWIGMFPGILNLL